MAITHQSGFPASLDGTNQATLAITPVAIGDLIVVAGRIAANVTVTGISGAGTGSWALVKDGYDATDTRYMYLWAGVATATGATTLTVTFSSTPGQLVEVAADSFNSGLGAGTTWIGSPADTLLHGTTDTSSPLPYPSLTPTSNGLYWGYIRTSNGHFHHPSQGLLSLLQRQQVTRSVITLIAFPAHRTSQRAPDANPNNYDSVAAIFVPSSGLNLTADSTGQTLATAGGGTVTLTSIPNTLTLRIAIG